MEYKYKKDSRVVRLKDGKKGRIIRSLEIVANTRKLDLNSPESCDMGKAEHLPGYFIEFDGGTKTICGENELRPDE